MEIICKINMGICKWNFHPPLRRVLCIIAEISIGFDNFWMDYETLKFSNMSIFAVIVP